MKKFKKTLAVFTALFMLCLVLSAGTFAERGNEEIWDGSIAEGFAGGSGTLGDPYLISNGAQLAFLAKEVNDGNRYYDFHFKLTDDIYLNDITGCPEWPSTAPKNEWNPIGFGKPFAGNFNGDGHTVFGIYCKRPDDSDIGLFGQVKVDDKKKEQAILKNIKVSDAYLEGSMCVGGIVGSTYGDKVVIMDCYNSGTVVGLWGVGGIGGFVHGPLTNCHNSGNIMGNTCTGGVIGSGWSITSMCSNVGVVTAYGDGICNVGGIVGGKQKCVFVLCKLRQAEEINYQLKI